MWSLLSLTIWLWWWYDSHSTFFSHDQKYISATTSTTHVCVGPKANNVSSSTTYDTVIFRFRVIPTSSPTPRVSSARSLAMGQLGRRRWSSATPPMTTRNTISRRCTIFIRVSIIVWEIGNVVFCLFEVSLVFRVIPTISLSISSTFFLWISINIFWAVAAGGTDERVF